MPPFGSSSLCFSLVSKGGIWTPKTWGDPSGMSEPPRPLGIICSKCNTLETCLDEAKCIRTQEERTCKAPTPTVDEREG